MKRREFITLVGGAAAWPLATEAQQPQPMRHVGLLMSTAANDRESDVRYTTFTQALQRLGWTNGSNLQIDIRWAAGDPERARKYAAELAALAPDVIVATGSSTLGPLFKTTRSARCATPSAAPPDGRR